MQIIKVPEHTYKQYENNSVYGYSWLGVVTTSETCFTGSFQNMKDQGSHTSLQNGAWYSLELAGSLIYVAVVYSELR